ncbi:MAG TPA: IS256 family transposase [Planctomycetota bacterium]|nr:IS256 family transposase [Planctomycetota bacterium]
MKTTRTAEPPPEAVPTPELEVFGPDPLAERLRGLVGGFIEQLVAEELEQVLHAPRYGRPGDGAARAGYRHSVRTRELTTSVGTTRVRVQRARLFNEEGEPTVEWRSELLPRYARRAKAVDDGIVMAYLSGANSRRIRGALKPLLKDAPLSKSAVSRVVRHLKQSFDEWRGQRFDEKRIAYVFLDAISVMVRADRRVQRMPVLVALGVHETGEKELLGLMLMQSESSASWAAMVEDLAARGLGAPMMCVIDGNAGLRSAIARTWPQTKVQRCVVHKLRNLEAHCPKRALDDLRRDFHGITEAKSEKAARAAYAFFVRTWTPRSEGVVRSLEEAGSELLTHYSFPSSQWKSLRTTNCIERLQGEFRRRIKTQASLPSESSLLYLFYALYASGQIRMRRIDGWQDIAKAIVKHQPERLQQAA